MNIKLKIYEIFKDKNYHTSNELANILGVSDKTVRNIINDMKSILKFEIKRGVGYKLKEISQDFSVITDEIPLNNLERQDYIISKLIMNKYIKIDDLSYELFVSNRTISNDLKIIKKNLQNFKLKLKSTPYYGLNIKGDEINIRNYIIKFMEDKLNKNIFDKNIFSEKFNLISKDTLNFIQKNNLQFSDIAFVNLVIAIYTMFKRIEKNEYINTNINNSILSSNNENIRGFIEHLNKIYYPKCKMTEYEISYILLNFFSKKTFTLNENKSIEIDNLIKESFKYIHLTYNLKITNNKELYDNLYKHLIPLTIRLRFNISFKNPILNEIKENMPFAYNIANYMANIICKKLECEISEDEIGYLAVIFEMSIEKNKNLLKKNVLIICPLGRGTSKFLQYTYMKLFAKYIENIHTTGVKDIKTINIDYYDLIFSIVDIEEKLNKPVYRVNCFLKDNEIYEIKKLFETDLKPKLNINKDLFIHINKKISKNELIKLLCNMIQKHTNSDFSLYEQVMEREKMGYTEIINNIAIPHPLTRNFNFNKIAVAILDKKIKWNKNFVNIVFLICISDIDEYSEALYSKLSNLFYSRKNLNTLLQNPDYKTLIKLLEKEDDINEL